MPVSASGRFSVQRPGERAGQDVREVALGDQANRSRTSARAGGPLIGVGLNPLPIGDHTALEPATATYSDALMFQSPSYRGPHSTRHVLRRRREGRYFSIPFLSATTQHCTDTIALLGARVKSQSPSYRGPHGTRPSPRSIRTRSCLNPLRIGDHTADALGLGYCLAPLMFQFPSYRGPHRTTPKATTTLRETSLNPLPTGDHTAVSATSMMPTAPTSLNSLPTGDHTARSWASTWRAAGSCRLNPLPAGDHTAPSDARLPSSGAPLFHSPSYQGPHSTARSTVTATLAWSRLNPLPVGDHTTRTPYCNKKWALT